MTTRTDTIGQNGNDGDHYSVVSGVCLGCSFDMMAAKGVPSCSIEAATGYTMGYPSAACCRGRVKG